MIQSVDADPTGIDTSVDRTVDDLRCFLGYTTGNGIHAASPRTVAAVALGWLASSPEM